MDLDRVRQDTPTCFDQVFLDSAGSSLLPAPVLAEVNGHLRREQEVGGYRAQDERQADLEDGYRVAAEFFDCAPDEVAFAESATRAWQSALASVPFKAGDRVLVTEAEYGGNAVALLAYCVPLGVSVEVVPSDADGCLSIDRLRDMLDDRVKLVSLVHTPTNGGLVNPVAEAIAAVHETDALTLLDACQTGGQLPVHAAALDADFVSLTGRKWLRAPRGSGLLIVRGRAKGTRPPIIDHAWTDWTGLDEIDIPSSARVHEAWESSVATRLGLIRALRYAADLGIDTIAEAVQSRAEHLRTGLSALPGVRVHDLGRTKAGIVTFTVDGHTADEVKRYLVQRDITVTVSQLKATRYDMTRRGLTEVVRASPHYFVAPQQLDEFLTAVDALTSARS
ncbi:aminotransferase class V-fold PLP-dependent enzyme [Pseudonocardiaceae bacterium YIM PH 21723]|nr:aminotransferase class V-fold PLP-dependent enzyme [Pseudonocardiaceae bacterium YIM PH 21723]